MDIALSIYLSKAQSIQGVKESPGHIIYMHMARANSYLPYKKQERMYKYIKMT